jgi:hypothetical protein
LQAHFGIISVLNEISVALYPENEYWGLHLYGAAARSYVQQIGFVSEVRKHEARVLLGDATTNANMDVIPNCGALVESLYDASETTRIHNFETRDYKGAEPKACLTYQSLETLLKLDWAEGSPLNRLKEIEVAHYFYDRVTELYAYESEPTFDFEVPGDPLVRCRKYHHPQLLGQ